MPRLWVKLLKTYSLKVASPTYFILHKCNAWKYVHYHLLTKVCVFLYYWKTKQTTHDITCQHFFCFANRQNQWRHTYAKNDNSPVNIPVLQYPVLEIIFASMKMEVKSQKISYKYMTLNMPLNYRVHPMISLVYNGNNYTV